MFNFFTVTTEITPVNGNVLSDSLRKNLILCALLLPTWVSADTKVAVSFAPIHPGVDVWVVSSKTSVGVEFKALEWSWDKPEYRALYATPEGQKFW